MYKIDISLIKVCGQVCFLWVNQFDLSINQNFILNIKKI